MAQAESAWRQLAASWQVIFIVAGLVEGKIFMRNWLVFPKNHLGFPVNVPSIQRNDVKWVMKNQTNYD